MKKISYIISINVFDYIHNNLCNSSFFIRRGVVLASKPYSAIHSYPIYKENFFGKTKMLHPTFWAILR